MCACKRQAASINEDFGIQKITTNTGSQNDSKTTQRNGEESKRQAVGGGPRWSSSLKLGVD